MARSDQGLIAGEAKSRIDVWLDGLGMQLGQGVGKALREARLRCVDAALALDGWCLVVHSVTPLARRAFASA